MYHHSVHYRSTTRSYQFWHRTRIFCRTSSNLNQTGATFTATSLKFAVVTHSRRNNIAADHTSSLQNGCSWINLYLNVINRYFYLFRHILFLDLRFKMMVLRNQTPSLLSHFVFFNMFYYDMSLLSHITNHIYLLCFFNNRNRICIICQSIITFHC
ncbi:hypothetical protein D3C72_914880 [compost metagenome]